MRRTTIALLAALEASIAVLVGLGIALVPSMLLWAVHFGLAAPVDAFFRGAVDVWLLGHGVDLVVQLDAQTAAAVGMPGADEPFTIGVALLGFAVLTFAFGMRIGRRATASGTPVVGAVSAVVTTAALATTFALSAAAPAAQPVIWQASVLPAVVMGAGVLAGVMVAIGRSGWATDAATTVVRSQQDALPAVAVAGLRTAIRVGVGSALGVIAVAAVLVTARIAIDHPTIIGLYQALGAGIDGGLAITLLELALLPNVIIWAAAWMLGPGFALGAGTVVSPSVTLLGPVPGLPLLGGLPAEGLRSASCGWGFRCCSASAVPCSWRGRSRSGQMSRGGRRSRSGWGPASWPESSSGCSRRRPRARPVRVGWPRSDPMPCSSPALRRRASRRVRWPARSRRVRGGATGSRMRCRTTRRGGVTCVVPRGRAPAGTRPSRARRRVRMIRTRRSSSTGSGAEVADRRFRAASALVLSSRTISLRIP
ncbi:hypothetical protein GCM10025870_26690 [Agromyces marinus]|uniref:Uncharacterized protein n=1 Tax=Agromyces marinus TaxID=1389020 RepID=A0ABM8H458_9MICO|nr:DUF6350 family protein [Agromyces marinus]BDZ55596.1 hypothetical protein GCM10025870_26690 [Agromyces marinus]